MAEVYGRWVWLKYMGDVYGRCVWCGGGGGGGVGSSSSSSSSVVVHVPLHLPIFPHATISSYLSHNPPPLFTTRAPVVSSISRVLPEVNTWVVRCRN